MDCWLSRVYRRAASKYKTEAFPYVSVRMFCKLIWIFGSKPHAIAAAGLWILVLGGGGCRRPLALQRPAIWPASLPPLSANSSESPPSSPGASSTELTGFRHLRVPKYEHVAEENETYMSLLLCKFGVAYAVRIPNQ